MCISATDNVKDQELPPKRRHVDVEIQQQPGRAEQSQGIINYQWYLQLLQYRSEECMLAIHMHPSMVDYLSAVDTTWVICTCGSRHMGFCNQIMGHGRVVALIYASAYPF